MVLGRGGGGLGEEEVGKWGREAGKVKVGMEIGASFSFDRVMQTQQAEEKETMKRCRLACRTGYGVPAYIACNGKSQALPR